MSNQPTSVAAEQPTPTAPTADDVHSPGLHQIATVARCEYLLAIRNRWAFALVGLFAVFGAMLVTFSGSTLGPDGAGRIIASLTSLSVYLVPLAALAFGFDAVVGRRQRGWLELVFALPVPRWRVITGAFMGRAAILTAAVVVGFGFVGLMIARGHGVAYWDVFVVFLIAAAAVAAVFLALAFVASSLAAEKTHALGFALLIWVWFVFAHDLLALGAVAAFDLTEGAMTALVAANPASTFRVLVLEQLGTTAGSGFTAAFAAAELSTGLLVASLGVWVVGAVAAAAFLVDRRGANAVSGLKTRLRRLVPFAAVVMAAVAMTGCFDRDDADTDTVIPDPVDLGDSRTCDVCGMVIEDAGQFGPNAQVFFDGNVPPDRDGPAHYDSVREMYVDVFGYRQRGTEPVVIYVTDYAGVDYDIETHRDEPYLTGFVAADTFADADDVVFVVDSGVQGAMGDDLIPFSRRRAAADFTAEHGGEIVDSADVDPQFIESL